MRQALRGAHAPFILLVRPTRWLKRQPGFERVGWRRRGRGFWTREEAEREALGLGPGYETEVVELDHDQRLVARCIDVLVGLSIVEQKP